MNEDLMNVLNENVRVRVEMEQKVKQSEEKKVKVQQLLEISLRKFRNQIVKNNLFFVDLKLEILGTEKKEQLKEKLGNLKRENDFVLKQLEVPILNNILKESEIVQKDN